ncbi:MAG TPA: 2-phosphosulfolactate phosphatase [Verrucomicrobiae bacterium]|jgi:2-phosphosulfolactate phosphatase
MTIETILSPLELPVLAQRDLRGTACVIFDILRATSTFVTALHNGAKEIIPVSEISETVAFHKKQPDVLLAGERDGVKIRAAKSGGIDFDFGNSPREFTPERVHGKTIVSTTTNGTRALQACANAKVVLAASFLNLTTTAESLHAEKEILLVCAGTGDNPASEDIIAAGALVELLASGKTTHVNKSANSLAARTAYVQAMLTNLEKSLGASENGSRLLAIPELHGDVAFCAQRDVFNFVARMDADGSLRRV